MPVSVLLHNPSHSRLPITPMQNCSQEKESMREAPLLQNRKLLSWIPFLDCGFACELFVGVSLQPCFVPFQVQSCFHFPSSALFLALYSSGF